MKTKRWPRLLLAVFTVLSFSACQDWGEMDPPAGDQTYPKLERVANINFEETEFDPSSFNYYAYDGGEIAVVEDSDDKLYGKVLHLPNGYARLFNPLNAVKVQNGVSMTFMLKQALQMDKETDEPLENDLQGAIFSFQNANGTQRMFLTANGWLRYEALDGTYEANNPETDCKTGMVENDGQWHYVALKVHNEGYEVYVDGKKKVEKTEQNFDFSKIVKFMASSPYLYIGYGADEPTKEMWIDDLRLYRNQITSKEVADYRKPSSGEEIFTYPVATKTTIGTPDCTSAWWSEFSDYYTIPANTAMRIAFTNHTSGVNNWNNWCLCLSTEAERGGDGYAEYFVIRSDLYGWGDDKFNLANFTNEGYGNDDAFWESFRKNMEGAKVTIDIERTGSSVKVTAIATCPDGTVYKEMYQQECGDGTQNVNAFLIVDASYLEMDTKETQYNAPVVINKQIVGTSDCSAAWWTEFSDYFTIHPNTSFEVDFTNHTSGVNNWNNWCLCLSTEAERGGDGYAEYFVIRSDLYGWGDDKFNLGNFTNEGYGNDDAFWETFRKNMEGAKVTIVIERSGASIKVTATATCLDGSIYKEVYQQECGDGTQNVNAFLIAEAAYLELDKACNVTKAFR